MKIDSLALEWTLPKEKDDLEHVLRTGIGGPVFADNHVVNHADVVGSCERRKQLDRTLETILYCISVNHKISLRELQ